MSVRHIWLARRRRRSERADRRRFANGFLTWLPTALTESQIAAVVSHARETLVVAGAGSGKTTLLLARAKYLVESGRGQQERILALAFNRSAAKELQDRSDSVSAHLTAMTFHGYGNSLLNSKGRLGGVAFGDDQSVERFLLERVRASLTSDPNGRLITFFSEMLVPFRDHSEFQTMADYAAYARAIPRAMSNHRVKSHGELVIANYLFVHGIHFEYESIYEGADRADWHRPDFTVEGFGGKKVFIEYFGIDGQGNTAPFVDRLVYNQGIDLKRRTHVKNGTTLVELTYQDLKDGVLISKLDEEITALHVPRSHRSSVELLAAANQVGYTNRFVKLCKSFLAHSRARRINSDALKKLPARDSRSRNFLSIFAEYLGDYERELERLGLPDFSAMIHEAADMLLDGRIDFPFDHVLVDEYQDVSADRQRLLEAMKVARPTTHFMYVGDDWQSINRFAGADIAIMRGMSRKSWNKKIVRLGETHRLPQSLAEVSSGFVQKNPSQLRKTIISKNLSTSTRTLVVHTDVEQGAPVVNLQKVVATIGSGNDGQASLLVIARYNSNLPNQDEIETFWRGPLDIRSIHRSKGSEADFVVVMDVVQDFRGFPSTIEDDPILGLVMPDSESYPYAEERRLFYVALTRARVSCHLIAPIDEPSLFVVELAKDDAGELNVQVNIDAFVCPVCRSGVLTRSSRDGGAHCSNSPHCNFRSPKCDICQQRLHVSSISPMKFSCSNHSSKVFTTCARCGWGVLLKRRGKFGEFLGCSNYAIIGCTGKASQSRRRSNTYQRSYGNYRRGRRY